MAGSTTLEPSGMDLDWNQFFFASTQFHFLPSVRRVSHGSGEYKHGKKKILWKQIKLVIYSFFFFLISATITAMESMADVHSLWIERISLFMFNEVTDNSCKMNFPMKRILKFIKIAFELMRNVMQRNKFWHLLILGNYLSNSP